MKLGRGLALGRLTPAVRKLVPINVGEGGINENPKIKPFYWEMALSSFTGKLTFSPDRFHIG